MARMGEEKNLKFYLILANLNLNSRMLLLALAFDCKVLHPLAPLPPFGLWGEIFFSLFRKEIQYGTRLPFSLK